MAQGMSRLGHPVKPVIHMAFMDVPQAVTGTTSDWVGPQANSLLSDRYLKMQPYAKEKRKLSGLKQTENLR